jgi:GNAT superfamily N-acetyltransferase
MKDQPAGISILPFHPDHQREVKRLILEGLVEHWGCLDEGKNLDLDDIAGSYSDGHFLVAWLDGAVVGTGAYLPRSTTEVEIIRMSVVKKLRRQGIGRRILCALCTNACLNGYQKVILETTRTWNEAIAFYQQFGFQITHYEEEDVYFALDLTRFICSQGNLPIRG